MFSGLKILQHIDNHSPLPSPQAPQTQPELIKTEHLLGVTCSAVSFSDPGRGASEDVSKVRPEEVDHFNQKNCKYSAENDHNL